MAEEKKSKEKFSEFDESVSYGAMHDHLNIKQITNWAVLGIVILVAIVIFVIGLFNFNKFQFQQQAAFTSEYQEFTRQRANEQARLNTYGVIDEERGIYHIPIDSAITLMINESR